MLVSCGAGMYFPYVCSVYVRFECLCICVCVCVCVHTEKGVISRQLLKPFRSLSNVNMTGSE